MCNFSFVLYCHAPAQKAWDVELFQILDLRLERPQLLYKWKQNLESVNGLLKTY